MTARSSHPTLGVRLPNSGPFADADALLATAAHAEDLGYERVWVHDHISWPQEKLTHFATGSLEACRDQDPNFFESVGTSAFLLGRLPRIGVGIAGLVLPLRDPRVLGKQLATLDRLGGPRLLVAVGIGAIPGDFDVMDVPFTKRGRISNDYLGALRTIFGAEQPTQFTSDTVSWKDGTFLPRPQGLQLWATGSSEPGLARAVAFADGWMTVYQSVADYQVFADRLDELSEAGDRPGGTMPKGYETYVCVGETHEDAVATARRSLEGKFKTLERGLEVCIVGTAETAAERIAAYGRAGAEHLELKFIGHDLAQVQEQMSRVAAAVPAASA